MKVAVISGNRERIPHPVVPLGPLYLMASIPDRHTKVLWDLCFEEHPLNRIQEELATFRPDMVVLSLRNIETTEYSAPAANIDFHLQLMAALRAGTRAPVALGGSGFSVLPDDLMTRLKPDFGLTGEGESALSILLDSLESGTGNFDSVPGLRYFKAGSLRSNPPAKAFLDLDKLPRPDRALVDPRYYESCGIEPVQTKRGCALKCDYCIYPLIEGRTVRMRKPAAVVDELFRALESRPKISHFFFVDSVFNSPINHAKAVCREMIRRRLKTPWTCYISPLYFDAELAGLFAEAGCSGIEVGSDSGCDEILNKLKKGFDTRRIRELHRLCQESGVLDCHSFILDTPGETPEQLERSLDFIIDLKPHSAVLMFWTDYRDALDPSIAVKREAARQRQKRRLLQRKADFPYWIIPALGINFGSKLTRDRRGKILKAPAWQYLRLMDIA